MPSPAPRLVVGAIIVDNLECPSRVCAARRTRPEALAGLWEFPGGKTEQGETPQAALVREVIEELGATIEVGAEVPYTSGAWPISDEYELRLYFAAVTDGELVPGDSHDQLQWLAPGELHEVRWLASDARAIRQIQTQLAGEGPQ